MICGWSKNKKGYTMEQLYDHIGTTRQSVSQVSQRNEKKVKIQNAVLEQVLEIRKDHPRMGSRVLYAKLDNPMMGITAFERLMSSKELTVPSVQRRIITTNSDKQRRFPNLSNGLKINNINQLAVGDITYYSSYGTTYYIFTLKDFYSGRIVGLSGDTNMKEDKAMDCFLQLQRLRGRCALRGLIHHTDGGGQYRSDLYIDTLLDRQIKISQSENCLQNGCAEQFNDIVKNHYMINEDIVTVPHLQKALKKIKRLINYERPVKKLGYQTPVEFEEQIKDMPESERKEFERFNFELGTTVLDL